MIRQEAWKRCLVIFLFPQRSGFTHRAARNVQGGSEVAEPWMKHCPETVLWFSWEGKGEAGPADGQAQGQIVWELWWALGSQVVSSCPGPGPR